jgi:hypothetical protein
MWRRSVPATVHRACQQRFDSIEHFIPGGAHVDLPPIAEQRNRAGLVGQANGVAAQVCAAELDAFCLAQQRGNPRRRIAAPASSGPQK